MDEGFDESLKGYLTSINKALARARASPITNRNLAGRIECSLSTGTVLCSIASKRFLYSVRTANLLGEFCAGLQ